MNAFTAKKLAEVQAFADLSEAIINKGGVNLNHVAPEITKLLGSVGAELLGYIKDPVLQGIFRTKNTNTAEKLSGMMELYINDEWSDAGEVLEWLSFYAGAADAHATLAAKAMESLGLKQEQLELERISKNFELLLDAVKMRLGLIGMARAKST